nr:unnamed protein product [Callosobruchus analis]CAI5829501.1 unnamed protein product [Callosobruchus analis]CAI5831842.1 unnamed protein product [Callosobruchus analis]CAI5842583.1 unnamed protein product [Callosobruchus analis]CAI5849259.1 unnamed protein product [Callosobruchus analis]
MDCLHVEVFHICIFYLSCS